MVEFNTEPSSHDRNGSGNLLAELERRQDDVLKQLDELDQKLCVLLRGLGVTPVESEVSAAESGPNGEEGLQDRPFPSRLDHEIHSTNLADATAPPEGGFAKLPTSDLQKLAVPPRSGAPLAPHRRVA